MEQQTTLQTVERAIAFLEFVAESSNPPHIKELAEALDLNITTCYHLLRTLVGRGYIKRRTDGRLELGEGVNKLFRSYRRAMDIEENLGEVVKRLAAQTLETCTLSLIDGNNVTLKVLIEGSQRLRVAGLYVGLKGHEYRRAAGKAVLAYLDEQTKSNMLDQSMADMPDRQKKTIRKNLEKELKQIATRGWAVDDGQTEEGIIAMAAPIFAASGEIIGAVGVVTPTFRMDRSRDAIHNAVFAAASEANQLLKEASES